MAYYNLFPEKDATLYSHPDRTKLNTGHDEILEVVKEKGSSDARYYPSRILVKFPTDEIATAIRDIVGVTKFNATSSVEVFTSCSVSLQLLSTEHKNLPAVTNLEVFAISQSWDEGTGRFSNVPTSSNGCSWEYRDNDITKTAWVTGSESAEESNQPTFSPGTTGSISSSNGNVIYKGGGQWFTGSSFTATQQFLEGQNLDTNFDVTKIVHKWSASFFGEAEPHPDFLGCENQGFLIKLPDTIETNVSQSLGTLSYFSTDTHTIYPPKLVFKWKDNIDTEPSVSDIKSSGELSVILYNNKEEYNQNEVALFRVHVRDKYPTRSFTTTSNNLNVGYFTSQSFYSVRDAHTEEEIIPFDEDFTILSNDSKGMYFKIYMKGLQPERYYRVLIKHKNNDGTMVYDDNHHFKVIR